MRFIDADAVHAALDYPGLVATLRDAFVEGCMMPTRHHHALGQVGGQEATLLLMPAWSPGQEIGVKVANVFPGNAHHALPAVSATYLLFDGTTGQPRAVLDGAALTVRRTAAASALAASYLARRDVDRLLVVGTGKLAPHLARAHAAVRDYREIVVWGRRAEAAREVAEQLGEEGYPVAVADRLEDAVRGADVVSCATLSESPLVRGEWLSAGTHLDLVGGFTPRMREADDTCIRRAELFVDTREGACSEAGDIVQPLESGVIDATAIRADLYELCRGSHPGREQDAAITLFKSVGAALEDLAAARMVAARADAAEVSVADG
jgi:ornithine cyclodeaminase